MTPQFRACGSCSLCCKVLRVDELQKPMGQWYAHFKAGVGCSIHGSHPQSCRHFQCLWILSPTMPDAVRPDRCKVVMTIDDGGARIIARADPADPSAWRREPIHGQLRRWAADSWFKGRTIWAMVGTRMWLITPDRDIDIGETDERCPTAYQQAPDGTITVIVLPPLPQGEPYDPAAMQAAVDAGQGQRFISPRPLV
jgi:hypothetical protein